MAPSPTPCLAAEGTILYGGSFCPPHRTHLQEARAARRAVDARRVVLVPTSPGATQYAQQRGTAGWVGVDELQRLAMTWLATRGEPGLEVSAIEAARPEPGYSTSRTVLEMAARTDEPLWLLIGADVMAEIDGWRDLPAVLAAAHLLVSEYPPHELLQPATYLPAELAARYRQVGPRSWLDASTGRRIEYRRLETDGLSSSRVRRAAAHGEDLERFVPPQVARYIRHHRLFGWPGKGVDAGD